MIHAPLEVADSSFSAKATNSFFGLTQTAVMASKSRVPARAQSFGQAVRYFLHDHMTCCARSATVHKFAATSRFHVPGMNFCVRVSKLATTTLCPACKVPIKKESKARAGISTLAGARACRRLGLASAWSQTVSGWDGARAAMVLVSKYGIRGTHHVENFFFPAKAPYVVLDAAAVAKRVAVQRTQRD